jgi:putative nucleotidyltransferase with HDIG domain
MEVGQAHNIVSLLVGAWQSHRMYPAGHPSRDQKARDCHEQLSLLLMERSPLRIGLVEGTLFIEEHLFADPHIAENEAVDIFETLQIEGLELIRGLSRKELDAFFSLTTQTRAPGGNALEAALAQKGVDHLHVATLLQGEEKPRAVYNSALKAVDHIFQDIQGGRIPSTEAIRSVSKDMVQTVLREEHALFALSQIKDYDNYTFNHSVNVGIVSLAVGRSCGLRPQQLQLLAFGGMIHDIGKLKIPVEIITKPGKLTSVEFEQVRRHPSKGVEMISQIGGVPQEVVDMVHFHHLHYNRDGYPQHSGRNISPLVEMVTIADHYDAMTTHRSYQRPSPPREAIRRMMSVRGTHLQPDFLDRFIEHLGEYPVGSLLRLDSSEIVLVTGFGPKGNKHLKLLQLFDALGKTESERIPLELLPDEHARIVDDVDPLSRGIDITAYFD